MSLVLLVDASAVCRELLAKVLESQGFSVTCARSCAEASRALAATTPQLLILEPAIDGEGIRFLESLRLNARSKDLPVIALTELSDRSSVMRVAQLGVRDYILKSRFSLAELLIRVQRYVRPGVGPVEANVPGLSAQSTIIKHPLQLVDSSTTAQPLQKPKPSVRPISEAAVPRPPANTVWRLTREETIERIEASSQTKTLPGVVAEVICLVNSPRGAISDVAQAVKRDPVLSARVLQLANSAAFMSQKPTVANIDEAVRNIGVGGVRNIVLAAGIFESLSMGGDDQLEMLRLWQHFFAVASIMERLVPPSDAAPSGSAHLVGLCHDLGELVLRQQFPNEYASALELARRTQRTLPQVGSEVFGVPFHELVTLLLGKLGLPPLITVPIEEFFERGVRKQHAGLGSVLSRALRIANVYAHGLMLAPTQDAPVTPISKTEYRSAFGDSAVVRLDDRALWSESLMMVNMLSGVSCATSAKLSQPFILPTGSRILYVRHASYCDFDPVAALLGFVGGVEVRGTLPKSAAELAGFDILINAALRQENPSLAQQDIDSILKLIDQRPIPLLYLSGIEPVALPRLPPGSCYKLPVQLSSLGEFFTKSA